MRTGLKITTQSGRRRRCVAATMSGSSRCVEMGERRESPIDELLVGGVLLGR
jgi:hypothetical protein